MTALFVGGMLETGTPSRVGASGYRRRQQAGAVIGDIEAELMRIDQEIRPYGSFENTPDELLRRYALLLHRETVAQALQAGAA